MPARKPLHERVRQPGEGVPTVGVHDVEHSFGQTRVGEQLVQRGGRRGGVLGGLPDDGVATKQRRDDVPGRHRDREVAGRDDHGGADSL
jgi:hypothetical protein